MCALSLYLLPGHPTRDSRKQLRGRGEGGAWGLQCDRTPCVTEASMCAHRWVLLLSLWQGQFGAYPAMPPNGGHPARTPPLTRPATESSVLHRAPDTDGLWPFWVSVDVPSDPEGSLPVSLTSDPQGLPQAGNTPGPKPAVSPSLKYSTFTSTALLPEPGTQILWGKESLSTSRDAAPWLQDTELLTAQTSAFTHLSPAQVEVPHLIPQPTHSLRGKDAASQNPTKLTPGLPPFTATPNGNTAALLPAPGAPAPALPLPPESAGPQAGRERPIAGPTGGRSTTRGARTRERSPKSGGSPTKDKEAKAGAPNVGGVLEGAEPTKTLTPTTKSPGCKQTSLYIPVLNHSLFLTIRILQVVWYLQCNDT